MARVRLIDIAKVANVSVSAVSKALANSPEISGETKRKIWGIAKDLGYHSHSIARSLRLGKNYLLGVIIPNNTAPFYSRILEGIAERARASGYEIVIANSYEDPDKEAGAINSMLSIPVAGLLATPVSLKNYEEINTHIVFISRYPYRELNFHSRNIFRDIGGNYVVNDDFEGQYLAVSHLLAKGARNIFLSLDCDDNRNVSCFKSHCRLDGYRRALEEYDIPYDSSKVFFNIDSNNIELCQNLVQRICQDNDPPFGLALTNDYISFGAYQAVRNAGLLIPDQVKIIGYDDIPMSAHYYPPLTTVHPANRELGICGASHVINMIEGVLDSRQKTATVLNPYLVTREST